MSKMRFRKFIFILLMGLLNPISAFSIQDLMFNTGAEPHRLCVAVLVEEPEIKIAFLDGITRLSAEAQNQNPNPEQPKRIIKTAPKYNLSIEYGYLGLMNCLNPYKNYERTFILAHSMLNAQNQSALVYFRKVATPSGEKVLYPFLVPEEILVKIKKPTPTAVGIPPKEKALYIATCYPDLLQGNYTHLLGSEQGVSNSRPSIFVSEADGVQVQAGQGGRQLLRLTSVESALKLFAQFLDFR